MKLIKHIADTLPGPALAWLLAEIGGTKPWITPFGGVGSDSDGWAEAPYAPYSSWAQGGPLIDRYRPIITLCNGEVRAEVMPLRNRTSRTAGVGTGPTYLMAVCRAIVIAELGVTVRVPKELVRGPE